jgi:hypothetical protein
MAAVLTSVGENWIVDKLDETVAALTDEWIALGTSTTAGAKGDTSLGSETTQPAGRAEGTLSQPSADIHRIVGTVTFDLADEIGEGGNFTSSDTGDSDLIVRGEFTPIVVSSGDKIELTIDLEIT